MTTPSVLWWERAACRGIPSEIAWSHADCDHDLMKQACALCPVVAECLADAQTTEGGGYRYLVRGGMTPTEREEAKLPRRCRCVICGKQYDQPPRSRRETCDKVCQAEMYRRNQIASAQAQLFRRQGGAA